MMGYRAAMVIFASVAFCAQSQEADDAEVPVESTDDGDELTSQLLRGIHERIDTDKNGKVSMTEVLKYSAEMRKILASKEAEFVFKQMDANEDGKVNLDELLKDTTDWSDVGDGSDEEEKAKTQQAELRKEQLKVADTDKDGVLSIEELASVVSPETHDGVLEVTTKHSLVQKDQDGDGQLSLQELWQGEGLNEEDMSSEQKEEFKMLDADGNGFLSSEELQEWESGMFSRKDAMQELFDMADKDKDMHLSADEIEEAREKIADSAARHHFMEWAEHSEL